MSVREIQRNTEEDSKRGKETKKLQDREQQNYSSKFFPVINYFKCKWIKISNQRTESD